MGDLVNLENAIAAQQQALRLTQDGHSGKPACSNNLGTSLRQCFERLGGRVDIHEAIKAQQRAVRFAQDSLPEKPACLNSLGNSLYSRFEQLGNLADLNDRPIRLAPDGNTFR